MARIYPHLSKILKKLLFDKGMKPIDLSRDLDIPQPTIHRLITGKTKRPYKSSLEPIADYFSISLEQLVGEAPLQVSPDNDNKLAPNQKVSLIPLLKWEEIDSIKDKSHTEGQSVAVMSDIGKNAFAVVMPDTSMEPLFSRESVLIFDPDILPSDRSYVLVKLASTQSFAFRQLLVDLEHRYIKALNPDLNGSKMYLLTDQDKIISTLVESRVNFQETKSNTANLRSEK